jgi:hypothetical protein
MIIYDPKDYPAVHWRRGRGFAVGPRQAVSGTYAPCLPHEISRRVSFSTTTTPQTVSLFPIPCSAFIVIGGLIRLVTNAGIALPGGGITSAAATDKGMDFELGLVDSSANFRRIVKGTITHAMFSGNNYNYADAGSPWIFADRTASYVLPTASNPAVPKRELFQEWGGWMFNYSGASIFDQGGGGGFSLKVTPVDTTAAAKTGTVECRAVVIPIGDID